MAHKVRELAISYLIHYRSDFDAVKSKVGLLDEYMNVKAFAICLPKWGTPSRLKVDFDAVTCKVGLLDEYFPSSYNASL